MDNNKIISALILIIVAVMTVGCKSNERIIERETVRTDSLFKVVTDTVTVSVRVAEMPYTLPVVQLERTTNDTLSVLQDSLYKSVALVSGGRLYHSLYTLPNAVIRVPVLSIDTTKVRTEREYMKTASSSIKSVAESDEKKGNTVMFAIVASVFFLVIGFLIGYRIRAALT